MEWPLLSSKRNGAGVLRSQWHHLCVPAAPDRGHVALRGRILVVDDEPSLRAVMAEALAAEGYEVSQAADGARALDLLRRARADAIVLDLTMPIMDGWAFLQESEQASNRAIGVVAVSAVMDQQVAERLRALGVRYCLAKPFDIDELLACVARVVATARPDKGLSSSAPAQPGCSACADGDARRVAHLRRNHQEDTHP